MRSERAQTRIKTDLEALCRSLCCRARMSCVGGMLSDPRRKCYYVRPWSHASHLTQVTGCFTARSRETLKQRTCIEARVCLDISSWFRRSDRQSNSPSVSERTMARQSFFNLASFLEKLCLFASLTLFNHRWVGIDHHRNRGSPLHRFHFFDCQVSGTLPSRRFNPAS